MKKYFKPPSTPVDKRQRLNLFFRLVVKKTEVFKRFKNEIDLLQFLQRLFNGIEEQAVKHNKKFQIIPESCHRMYFDWYPRNWGKIPCTEPQVYYKYDPKGNQCIYVNAIGAIQIHQKIGDIDPRDKVSVYEKSDDFILSCPAQGLDVWGKPLLKPKENFSAHDAVKKLILLQEIK